MLVLAHRGYHATVPENSADSIAAARQAGFDGVEVDVRRCGSGELVLHHDETAAGVPVGDLSLVELRAAVPSLATLDEAARSWSSNGGLFAAELKEAGIAADTYRALASGAAGLLMVSFIPEALREAARILPREQLGRLLCPGERHWIRELAGCGYLSPARLACPPWEAWRGLSLAFVPSRTLVWGLPPGDACLRNLRRAGVRGIITDHVEHAG